MLHDPVLDCINPRLYYYQQVYSYASELLVPQRVPLPTS